MTEVFLGVMAKQAPSFPIVIETNKRRQPPTTTRRSTNATIGREKIKQNC